MSIDRAYTGQGSYAFTQDEYSLTQFIVQQAINGIATATLVEVVAVGDDTVDVRPMNHQLDGANTATPHGIINGLPVFALRAGACVIRIKPRVGDIGQVVFCHNDISTLKTTKRAGPPSSRRRFDWSDGIYYGGLLPKSPATTIIEVDEDNNVAITAPTIRLNGNVEHTGDWTSSGTVTGAADVIGGGKSLKAHTHGGVTTGSGTSGPPS